MYVFLTFFLYEGEILCYAGRLRGMSKIALWSQNIANHFWYCCRTCDGDLATLKVAFVVSGTVEIVIIFILKQNKWRGVLHHVCDKHEWYQGECDHDVLTEPPTNTYGMEIPYFVRGDSDFKLLQKILTDKRWMFSLKYFTQFRYIDVLGYWVCKYLSCFVDTLVCLKTFIILCCCTVQREMHSGKSNSNNQFNGTYVLLQRFGISSQNQNCSIRP